MTLTATESEELGECLDEWGRTRAVAYLVDTVIDAAQLVRATPEISRDETAEWVLAENSARLDILERRLGGMGRAARWFFEDMAKGAVDPDKLAGRERREVASCLESALADPQTGFFLLVLLAAEKGQVRPSLATMVDVGRVLEELRRLDPSLSVAGPGIEAYYDHYQATGMVEKEGVAYGVGRVVRIALG